MKTIKAVLAAAAITLSLAAGVFVVDTAVNTEPAEAHEVRGCALRQVKGSTNWSWASDTYDNHSSPTNCEVRTKLARNRYGSKVWYYGSWGIIRSYVYTNAYSPWNGGARNCGKVKVPSTGWEGSWYCN